MKFKNYYKPTPKKWRHLGDSLLALSLYAQTQEVLSGNQRYMVYVSIAGLLGKFLTNFFAEDDKPKTEL